MQLLLFSQRLLPLLLLGLAGLSGCNPEVSRRAAAEDSSGDGSNGTYYAAPNKLFDRDLRFDIRWKVTHWKPGDSFDPTIQVDNRTLTLNRCDECHNECGFARAFDLANYGKQEWNPQYRGEEWSLPIRRMIDKENSFLNEGIAERIYRFLRDETTGGYDLSKDPRGSVNVEVDESGSPIRTTREETPQPTR